MNWLRNFMMGRYGGDQLGIGILILSMLVNLVPYWPARIVSLVLLALAMLRMLSRNITARSRENQRFLRIWLPVKHFFVRLFRRRPDRKTHRRFRCKNCGQELRVPRGKGKISITCPKCAHKFIRKS